MATPIIVPRAAPMSGFRQTLARLPLTSRPDTPRQRFINSGAVWLVLMAYWALSDVIITIHATTGRPYPPQDVPAHVGFTIAGLLGIWCSHQTGFLAAIVVRLGDYLVWHIIYGNALYSHIIR